MPTVLTVSDLHCPYQHPSAWDFLADLKRAYRPSSVVVLGDEVDFAAYSRFAKDPEGLSPGDELKAAVAALKALYKIFPRASVVHGNHSVRPFKRASEAGLPNALLRSFEAVLEAPRGWEWVPDKVIDSVLYIHGDGFSGKNAALTAAETHRHNVVIGHVHCYAGVQYTSGRFNSVWGMNAGCLIDPSARVFDYAKHYARRPTLGTGLVIDGVPHFVPLES